MAWLHVSERPCLLIYDQTSERVEWREREGHMLEGGSLHIPPPRFYPGGEGFFFLFTGRAYIYKSL